jgi:hypothetical protein
MEKCSVTFIKQALEYINLRASNEQTKHALSIKQQIP